MAKRRLALDINGNITYCSAKEENIGKGRCTHIDHQKPNESTEEFIKRMEEKSKKDIPAETKTKEPTDPYADLPEEDRVVSDTDMAHAIIKSLKKGEYKEEVEKDLRALEEYSIHVASMSNRIKYFRFRIDDWGLGEYQQQVMKLDRERKEKHTYALGKLADLNSIATKAGLPPIYQGDIDVNDRQERHRAADFIFRLFNNPLVA